MILKSCLVTPLYTMVKKLLIQLEDEQIPYYHSTCLCSAADCQQHCTCCLPGRGYRRRGRWHATLHRPGFPPGWLNLRARLLRQTSLILKISALDGSPIETNPLSICPSSQSPHVVLMSAYRHATMSKWFPSPSWSCADAAHSATTTIISVEVSHTRIACRNMDVSRSLSFGLN